MLCHPQAIHRTLCNVNCISNSSQRMHNLSRQIIHMLGLFRYRPASPPPSSPPLPLPLSPLIWLLFAILTDYLFVCLYSRRADIMYRTFVILRTVVPCIGVGVLARVCVSVGIYIHYINLNMSLWPPQTRMKIIKKKTSHRSSSFTLIFSSSSSLFVYSFQRH